LSGRFGTATLRSAVKKQFPISYFDLGAYDRAIAMHREALRLRRQLYGDLHADVARSRQRLAGALANHGELDEAESLDHEARATWEKLLGPDHPKGADSLLNLGTTWFQRNDWARAQPSLSRHSGSTVNAKIPTPRRHSIIWPTR